MKTFVAVYIGTPQAMERSGWLTMSDSRKQERQREGIEAWERWAEANKDAIVDGGAPLGKTKKVSAAGIEDSRNNLAAYVVVRAATHEAAARLFEGHPHFTIFPGDSVEIMECLPIPGG
ncbi:MAG: hypothetical protein JSS40_14255 [Proteobacteria bacterium]|nr:hypothetical protein [Pseudomonadota bacterium]